MKRVLIAVFVVAGCASGGSAKLLTAPAASPGCFTNFAQGPLVVDSQYGTDIQDATSSGQSAPVLWPQGFTARRNGTEIEVYDAAGRAVAMTGRSYKIEGGYVASNGLSRAFLACGFIELLAAG